MIKNFRYLADFFVDIKEKMVLRRKKGRKNNLLCQGEKI